MAYSFPVPMLIVRNPHCASDAGAVRKALQAALTEEELQDAEIDLIGAVDAQARYAEGIWRQTGECVMLPPVQPTLAERTDFLLVEGSAPAIVRGEGFNLWRQNWARTREFCRAVKDPDRAGAKEVSEAENNLLSDELSAHLPAELRDLRQKFALADTVARNFGRNWTALLNRSLLGALVASLTLVFYYYFYFDNFSFFDSGRAHFLHYLPAAVSLTLVFYSFVKFRQRPPRKLEQSYIEYRALAESLRVLFYLRMGGLAEDVGVLLDRWRLAQVGWVTRVAGLLSQRIPPHNARPEDVRSVLHQWCEQQKRFLKERATAARRAYHNADRLKRISLSWVPVVATYSVISAPVIKPFLHHHIANDILRAVVNLLLCGVVVVPVLRAYFVTRVNLLSLPEAAHRYHELEKIFRAALARLAAGNDPPDQVLRLLAEEAVDETAQWVAVQSRKTLELPS